jgi:hypothetical protein
VGKDEVEGGPILKAVAQFLTEDDWKFRKVEDQPVLTLGFKGENGSWRCFAQSKEEQERFIFYSVMESNVPPETRDAVGEFITRANYGMIIGNLEMDYNDGEVRYKTSIDIEGGELTPGMIKSLIYVNVMMMDRYLPGIMSVIYAGTDPAEAVAKVES